MRKKHDELATCVELQNFDLVGIRLMQWNSLHDWSTSAELLGLFLGRTEQEVEEVELPFI